METAGQIDEPRQVTAGFEEKLQSVQWYPEELQELQQIPCCDEVKHWKAIQ